jgi:RNA polymerase sigma-70 factor, ECF subfamily
MDAIKETVIAGGLQEGLPARAEEDEVGRLIERAKTGDAEAFGDLMRLYEGRIIGVGMQMGLSREDALDACQETFIKVFRYIRRFHSGRSFFKWLYRIAIHAVYDQMRSRQAAGTISIEELAPSEAARLRDRAAPLAQRVEHADLAGKLLAGLDALSRQERIVFVLRDLQDIGTEDIGRIMRLSRVTVRRHCMSARQKLRNRLFPRDH